jgi:hypothetical protein
VCPEPLKSKIIKDARANKYVDKDEEIAMPHYFPALSQIDQNVFLECIEDTPYGKLLANEAILQTL